MPAEYENRPLSHPQVAAIELVAEVLAKGEVDPNADTFYGRLCEVTCEVTSLTRAVIFRYDAARRRVRAAGSYGIDLSLFEEDFFTVESAPLARRALEINQVIECTDDLENQLPVEYVRLLGTTTVVCSPMSARGYWVGVILADRGGPAQPMDDAERELLWILGKVAALASMARMATLQQENALQLEQRIDLAREVHERVIQRLFGVSLALSGDHELDAESRRRAQRRYRSRWPICGSHSNDRSGGTPPRRGPRWPRRSAGSLNVIPTSGSPWTARSTCRRGSSRSPNRCSRRPCATRTSTPPRRGSA